LEQPRDYFVPTFHQMYKRLSYYAPESMALSLPVVRSAQMIHSQYFGPWAHKASYHNPEFLVTALYYIGSLSLNSFIDSHGE